MKIYLIVAFTILAIVAALLNPAWGGADGTLPGTIPDMSADHYVYLPVVMR